MLFRALGLALLPQLPQLPPLPQLPQLPQHIRPERFDARADPSLCLSSRHSHLARQRHLSQPTRSVVRAVWAERSGRRRSIRTLQMLGEDLGGAEAGEAEAGEAAAAALLNSFLSQGGEIADVEEVEDDELVVESEESEESGTFVAQPAHASTRPARGRSSL